MTIARSTGAFMGTDESTLQAVTAGQTLSGSEVDVLGGDAAAGEVDVYAVVTFGTVAATSGVNVKINKRRVTGQAYVAPAYPHSVTAVASTTVKQYLGRYSAARFMSATVQNLDASNAVSVAILFELFKLT